MKDRDVLYAERVFEPVERASTWSDLMRLRVALKGCPIFALHPVQGGSITCQGFGQTPGPAHL